MANATAEKATASIGISDRSPSARAGIVPAQARGVDLLRYDRSRIGHAVQIFRTTFHHRGEGNSDT